MNIYYYVPEQNRPSWGAGMIYYQVWLLQKNNFNAHVLHAKKPYKLAFIEVDLSFQYMDNKALKLEKEDFLIIPEFYADLPVLRKYNCRKIAFVQNAHYIYDGLKIGQNYEDLGFERVFYYMAHLQKILQQLTSLPLYETPPFVAPYFYNNNINGERRRTIIMYPKFDSRDYEILKRVLRDKLGLKEKTGLKKWFSKKGDWEIVELKNRSHTEVAEEMKKGTFFISLNTTESFNAAVPEAMAAGCINICFDGVGPADYLENNKNAFVFPNNHIFPMIEKIIDLVNNYDETREQLNFMRMNARQTADLYTIDKLESKLIAYFKEIDSVV